MALHLFTVEKAFSRLTKDVIRDKTVKLEYDVVLYLMSVLDYVSADVLKLSGNYTRNCKCAKISLADISTVLQADPVLQTVFSQLEALPSMESPNALHLDIKYDAMIKELILAETSYRNTLDVIVKGFFETFQAHAELFSESVLLDVFGNITEILTLTQGLSSLLEDKLDMVEQDDDVRYPAVGECFASLAEEHEFSVRLCTRLHLAGCVNRYNLSCHVGGRLLTHGLPPSSFPVSRLSEAKYNHLDDTFLAAFCFDADRAMLLGPPGAPKVYTEYANNLPNAIATLTRVLKPIEARRQLASTFGDQGNLYVMAARFELPKLLLVPLYHINHYFALVRGETWKPISCCRCPGVLSILYRDLVFYTSLHCCLSP